tara:strand:+ start:8774 stop:9544 length:771 start_codon:yes stop_codon:yes gene_type:complete
MKKYLYIFLYNFFRQKTNQKDIIIRASFYLVLIYIFSCLWEISPLASKSIEGWRITWYIAITELIILSNPIIYFDIESDVRSGDIAYHLSRPIHYLWMRIFENLGAYGFRFIFLFVVGFLFCVVTTKTVLPWEEMLVSISLAFFSGSIFLLWHALIGLSAFTLQDCTPIFWLWQRSSFLLGGLLLPLDFYPEYLQKIAQWTPFASLLYCPAKQAIIFSPFEACFTFGKICFWAILAIFLASIFYKKAVRKLQVNGG